MKKTLFVIVLLLTVGLTWGQDDELELSRDELDLLKWGLEYEPYSWGRESQSGNEYLGKFSPNRYDPESISNPYGRFGSRYSSKSVNNPYGRYGSAYRRYSARNPYATKPPIIVGGDGTYLGKFSTDRYDPDSISNPYGRYGSKYSSESVNNPYGKYGSRYSPYSTRNPYTHRAPRIYGDAPSYELPELELPELDLWGDE